MSSIFYTVSGLPVHALVVHFVVVILPLATLAFIAAVYLPKIRDKYSFIVVTGLFLGSGAAFVAKQSGEALAELVGNPAEHADYGTYLFISSFILMLLSITWYRTSRGRTSSKVTPLGHAGAIAAIVVLALSILTGHTGAQAVWNGRLAPAPAATAAPTATAPSTVAGVYNSFDLSQHASSKSCWSAVSGNVYDLTKWIPLHPGGQSVIDAICGRDGTASFNGQHAGAGKPADELAKYKIGKYE